MATKCTLSRRGGIHYSQDSATGQQKKPVQAGVEGVHGRFKIMLSAKIAQPIYSDARQTI
jgi:hypothetical protein